MTNNDRTVVFILALAMFALAQFVQVYKNIVTEQYRGILG